MERDLHNELFAVHSIPPAVYTATKVGAVIDTKEYEGLEYFIHVGVALANGGFNALLEECETSGGTYTAVSDANRLGDLPVFVATDANLVLRVGTIGKMRYSRLTLTETSAVDAGVIGAIAVFGKPRTIPTTAQAT
jgi:hypothetical protein